MSKVHPTAEVSPDAIVDATAAIWQYAHVREGASIGAQTVVGRGAYVGPGVPVGKHCKIQNYALVYEPAIVEDGVFIGPAVVLTNDRNPRAVNPDGSLKSTTDWVPVGVTLRAGASIGARAVCVAPLVVGRWALVAAGSTVIRDVPDYALVVGAPARRIGWVGPAGEALVQSEAEIDLYVCPRTGARFQQVSPDELVALDADD